MFAAWLIMSGVPDRHCLDVWFVTPISHPCSFPCPTFNAGVLLDSQYSRQLDSEHDEGSALNSTIVLEQTIA